MVFIIAFSQRMLYYIINRKMIGVREKRNITIYSVSHIPIYICILINVYDKLLTAILLLIIFLLIHRR